MPSVNQRGKQSVEEKRMQASSRKPDKDSANAVENAEIRKSFQQLGKSRERECPVPKPSGWLGWALGLSKNDTEHVRPVSVEVEKKESRKDP